MYKSMDVRIQGEESKTHGSVSCNFIGRIWLLIGHYDQKSSDSSHRFGGPLQAEQINFSIKVRIHPKHTAWQQSLVR